VLFSSLQYMLIHRSLEGIGRNNYRCIFRRDRFGYMKKILLLTCLFYGAALQAQPTFWDSSQAYLGEPPPGDTPVRFGAALLPVKDSFDMDRVAFSADGKEFYYETNNTWFSTVATVLRSFIYREGRWVGPTTVFHGFWAPSFSTDQQTLYLAGNRIRDSLHAYVYQSARKPDGSWGQPTVFLREPYALYEYMTTNSGTGYAGSRPKQGGVGGMDACVMHFSAGDTSIQSLGTPLNTPGWDGDFFVARDESYIIISANETKPDGGWTAPVSLGPLINDGLAHRWGEYVTPDGKYLFYTRATGPENCHLYWVRFDKLLARMRAQAGFAVR
jgi:hypothetical protein